MPSRSPSTVTGTVAGEWHPPDDPTQPRLLASPFVVAEVFGRVGKACLPRGMQAPDVPSAGSALAPASSNRIWRRAGKTSYAVTHRFHSAARPLLQPAPRLTDPVEKEHPGAAGLAPPSRRKRASADDRIRLPARTQRASASATMRSSRSRQRGRRRSRSSSPRRRRRFGPPSHLSHKQDLVPFA